MRIAYIANYQGPTLGAQRPIVGNLSMSNRVKIELIATLLRRQSHEVVIIAPGEPGEPRFQWYPAFSEPVRFDPEIPVEYASALPIRRVTAAWSVLSTLRILRKAHREKPFDLVVIFNMKWPQLAAAAYATKRLCVPVVLEYEDNTFTSVHQERPSPLDGAHKKACRLTMAQVSGCIAVSPYLASQLPATTPSIVLRGVVAEDIVEAERLSRGAKQNWVVFAGTHIESNGVAQLIEGWKQLDLPGWELHITGQGHLTPALQSQAAAQPTIKFHGMVSREELVRILSSARVCINPHKVSETPGVVFAFKIIEYLAAGAHVMTTPMGDMEAALEMGVSYLADNTPNSIAQALRKVIEDRSYERTAAAAAHLSYGPAAVAAALDRLASDAVAEYSSRSRAPVAQIT